ncbi:MAG: 4'-phosphopantetheinyl transferase superfamily protein [Dysgonamonadaceae bacterium]|nr:4'-phosphopantetheinyl transferase superfamily protein [Dysgonamonadaceae bacterium]
MLIRKELVEKNCLMGIWKISETRDELYKMLTQESQREADRELSNIKSKKRALEWMSTRLILQELSNDNKIIEHNSQGQPFLSDKSFQISISHSSDYVVVLLHKYKKVGVDIENLSQRILKIEKRFISQEEYIDPENRTLHLILHWCAKETLYKLMDSTEIVFKKHLHIQPFNIEEKGLIKASESFTEDETTFNLHYEVNSNYVLTWGIL